jgi:ACR3 family arsenite transporter
VNLVVAVLIWAMVYPMMIGVDLGSPGGIGRKPKGLIITVIVNWLIQPFTMAALGVLFFRYVFADLIDPADAGQYIAGLILLGAAPCTAIVFVWSQLTKGDPNYTLVKVSLNVVIMVFAFAPIVALLLGVTDIAVPWETLVLSVVLYVVIPLAAGLATRAMLMRKGGQAAVDGFTARIKPASIFGLLATVVLLFGFQGSVILTHSRLLIVLLATPILIQSYGIFALAYGWAYLWKRAAQRRRALRADRDVELLRTGRGGRHRTVRPQLRRGAGDGGGRSGGGAGDAEPCRLRQPHAGAVSGLGAPP